MVLKKISRSEAVHQLQKGPGVAAVLRKAMEN
jgi:hypothetical protein